MRPIITRFVAVLLAALALAAVQPVCAESAPVNINTASAADLAAVKGIGPAKAQAIVEHREKNGNFKQVDDLKLVRGIGDKLIEQLRPQVTVDGAGKAAAAGASSAQR